VTSLKILGFEVTKNSENLEQNLNKAIDKIKNIIRFWNRFRLSLIGRINMAKTLLISQLNFYVCIIPVNERIVNEISLIINNFIRGQLKVSKDMFSLDINKGGIGFIDLKKFIFSLQCSWVKRAHNSSIDNWRLDLNKATQGNVEILTPEMFNRGTNPILHTIASSFLEFKHEFYLQNDNFINSCILGNPLLKKKRNNRRAGRANNVIVNPDPERQILTDETLSFDFWATAGVVNIPVLSQVKSNQIISNNFIYPPTHNIHTMLRRCLRINNQ
jgi:hypothetical protein